MEDYFESDPKRLSMLSNSSGTDVGSDDLSKVTDTGGSTEGSTRKNPRKLVSEEKMIEGGVKWRTYFAYLKAS